MRNVLVTGGAGFIGSHLCELLLDRGVRVTAVDDESTGSRGNLARCFSNERFTYVLGSVVDADLVERLTADVSHVYHLAAAVGVALIADSPADAIRRNIYPTDLLLQSLQRRHRAGEPVRFFLAGSSEIYGRNPAAAWSEDADIVLGSTQCMRWSYAASKAIDEFLTLATAQSSGLPVVVGRLFNVVGPRQTGAYGMVLPRLVDAAKSGRAMEVYDDGRQERCFAHVSDVVGAVTALMEAPEALGRAINIGSDRPVSILELAQKVAAAVDGNASIVHKTYAEAYGHDFQDVRRRVPDLTLLRSIIDFQPQYDLDAIIAELIE